MDNTTFDAAVVGAGPGGALTAYFLSCRGLKTLVIEKKRLPRHKPCAGGLTRRALDSLPFDVTEVMEDHPRTFVVTVAGRTVYRRTVDQVALGTVLRDRFDYFLVKKAVEAARLLKQAGADHGLPVISEIMDAADVPAHEAAIAATPPGRPWSMRAA